MSWENPVFADLLTICSHASIVAPIKKKNETTGEVEIIGYRAAPARRHQTLAVAMLTREMIGRVTKQRLKHGLHTKLDHFAWEYAERTNGVDVAGALAKPYLTIGGQAGGKRAAGIFTVYGPTNRGFAQMYSWGGSFVPTLMPLSEILSLAPLLKAEVTALHEANHDDNPEIDAVAASIESAYAAARPAYVARLQQSHPERNYA